MAIEFELKFRATEDVLSAINQAVKAPAVNYQMRTTYYDTPNGALSRLHYTLRCRLENGTGVCTLKTPADAGGRLETEVEAARIEDALGELCRRSGNPHLANLLQQGLVAVCGARFTRIAKTVTLPHCTVELALDQGVLTGGGRELPLCEVEVELKAGQREAAIAYAKELALIYGLDAEPKSKFRRARDLAKGE